MSSFDTYKALFLHTGIGCMNLQNADPTYKSIDDAAVQINTNANDNVIYSNSIDGNLGRMILTVRNTEYQAMRDRGFTFAITTVTPTHPVHPAGTTGPVITEANRYHKEEVCVFREDKDTDAALKHQLLDAVNKDYIAKLKHNKLDYADVTTLELLSHSCY